MAKIKRNNFLDTVNDVITDAINGGVIHLYAEDGMFSGRTIRVKGKDMYHFGTTGYLGLEQDYRLKKAAIEAIERYGTQFPLSKSYISHPLYHELEQKIGLMYNNPIIITKNSTLGHLGVIPSAVNDGDGVILDHQVHWSVQSAAKMLKTRSVPVEMIRHNHMDMLEHKIKKMSSGKQRIWYMADGIYSMYGDYAPMDDLKYLCAKYPQLHLYIDDVHGMSWIGKNGTGYAMHNFHTLPENVLVFGTLSKTFGASGAVLVCPNKKMQQKIKKFGGPLTFSAQLEPASIAAAIASARIHLSPEIYKLQKQLKQRVSYFNRLFQDTELPLIDRNDSPVFYIGTGMPKTGYNFVNRLMSAGFFVNLGLFPAVPVKNTGVRITISRHNQNEEIEALVAAMKYHYPKALEETQSNMNRVHMAFNLKAKPVVSIGTKNDFKIIQTQTIADIDKYLWNYMMQGKGVFDWDGLKFLEEIFKNNQLKEHNWRFLYVLIADENDVPIVGSFFTKALWKNDMLSSQSVSKLIEQHRKQDPYYLTSEVLSMGSLFTEGEHLFINQEHSRWKQALNELIGFLEKIDYQENTKMLVLRDFKKDFVGHSLLQGQGFIRVQMPDACTVDLSRESCVEKYIEKLSKRNRKHVRKEILPFIPLLDIQVVDTCSKKELSQIRKLYSNVHQNNLGLNTFSFPKKLFHNMNKDHNWEFIIIKLKEDNQKIIGVMLCYRNSKLCYVPAFVGLDYDYLKTHHIYRQLLYQTIKRAIAIKSETIDFGMTASFEKRKLGATIEEKVAYIQTSDNFILESLGILESDENT